MSVSSNVEKPPKEATSQSDMSWWRYALAAAVFFAVAFFYDSVIYPATNSPMQLDGHSADAEWDANPVYDFIDSTLCSIDRIPASLMPPERFRSMYLEQQPVIIVYDGGVTSGNSAFRAAVNKASLLERHGSDTILLSSGNRNSYDKKESTVQHYVNFMMHPQPLDRLGNETWYHFGDPHHATWTEVQSLYRTPVDYMFAYLPALSFGFAATGTGVPFHTHGHVFAEVLYGRKRWWLAPFGSEPRYDANESTLHWLAEVRPKYTAEEAANLLECVCAPGDFLYIPSNWHHATLNIGETVFMSVFL